MKNSSTKILHKYAKKSKRRTRYATAIEGGIMYVGLIQSTDDMKILKAEMKEAKEEIKKLKDKDKNGDPPTP